MEERQELIDEQHDILTHPGRRDKVYILTVDPVLATDVYESEHEVLVYMDVAGVEPDRLSVVLERERLTVFGEREFPVLDLCCVHQLEIDYGPFQRTIVLPVPVDAEGATSICRNGYLVVRMPKIPPAGKVTIPIS